MLPKFRYIRPATIHESILHLAKYAGRAVPIAGGTDLIVQMRQGIVSPKYIIDISTLSGLDYIKSDNGGLMIGALTNLHDLEVSSDVRQKAYLLAEAVKLIGTQQIRNTATLGGNICHASPSADTPVALIAMDSKAKIVSSDGERTVPLEEFFVDVQKTVVKTGELLTEIQVPCQPTRSGGSFHKLRRQAIDIAIMNVATRIELDSKETCKGIRIVLGAAAPTPIRARRAEALLKDREVTESLASEAGQIASEEIRPITDVRSSADYRRKMCAVLVKYAIQQAFERAKKERFER